MESRSHLPGLPVQSSVRTAVDAAGGDEGRGLVGRRLTGVLVR